MKVLDCFGDVCPVPILKIEQALKTASAGDEIMVVTDHSCTLESIRAKYTGPHIRIDAEEVINGVWEIRLLLLDQQKL